MIYERLTDFVQNRMRMSHVYQPVMLITLLRGGGRSLVRDLARSILAHDESQVEYYENVTKNMVGRVLRNHGIVEREASVYSLVGYEDLDEAQIQALIELCEAKLDEYKARRGKCIWQHRRVSAGYLSGTLRYEVLKGARFRCALCGVSTDERALEVDHIVPRSRGGTDDPDNLQALCYSCNSMIGVNSGEVAGQTVFHCHIHLIPRRRDDVEDPTGGVRNTIPGKGTYRH
jgi:ATP adenylyltransferase